MTPETGDGITKETKLLDKINNLQASVNALNFTYDFEESFSEDIDLDRLKLFQAETVFNYLNDVIPFIDEIRVNGDVFEKEDHSDRQRHHQATLEDINTMTERMCNWYGFSRKSGV